MKAQMTLAAIGVLTAAQAAVGQVVGPMTYDAIASQMRVVADPDVDIFDPVVGGNEIHDVDPDSESVAECDADNVNTSRNLSRYLFAAGSEDVAVFHMDVDHVRDDCEMLTFSEVNIFFSVSERTDYDISGFYDVVGGDTSVAEVRLTNVDTATDLYNGSETTNLFSATNYFDLAALATDTGTVGPSGTLDPGNYELWVTLIMIDIAGLGPGGASATGEVFVLLGDSVNPVNDIDGDGTDNLDDPCPTSAGPECPCDDNAAFCPCDDNNAFDIVDLLFILSAWGTPAGDIDGDGITGIKDLLELLAKWGPC